MKLLLRSVVITLWAINSLAADHSTATTNAAVVQMVVQDLTIIPHSNLTPLSFSRETPRRIEVHVVSSTERPCDFSWTFDELQASMPPEIRAAAAQANKSIDDARVDSSLVSALDSRAEPNVFVYPPGYSRRKTIAVVRLFFPEFLHPSIGIYVLQLRGTNWVIVAKKFTTFL